MNLNDELEIVRYIIDEKKIIYYSNRRTKGNRNKCRKRRNRRIKRSTIKRDYYSFIW